MYQPISDSLRKALTGIALLSVTAVTAFATAGSVLAAPNQALSQVVTSQTCSPTAITRGSVNLRTGPGTNFPVILTMPPAVQVAVTGRNANGSWYQVVFNGQQGWTSAEYLLTSCVGNVPVVNTPALPTAPTPTPTPPPAQSDISFVASATSVPFGQCTTLIWNVPASASNQVFLGFGAMLVNVPFVGSQQACPAVSTLFYLRTVANGVGQNYPLDITVTGNPNNPANFRSNAYVVSPGQCPTLSWNVENVNGVFLYANSTTPMGVNGNGTQQVCVSQPSSFALRVVRNDGTSTVTPLTVNLLNQQPANVQFIANPTAIQPGQCAQLQWLAGNARTVNLLDSSTGSKSKVGGVGNIQVCPSRTAVYTIQALLLNGTTAQQSQTVNVASTAPTPIPLPQP
jgi:uncharacterized protein YraI